MKVDPSSFGSKSAVASSPYTSRRNSVNFLKMTPKEAQMAAAAAASEPDAASRYETTPRRHSRDVEAETEPRYETAPRRQSTPRSETAPRRRSNDVEPETTPRRPSRSREAEMAAPGKDNQGYQQVNRKTLACNLLRWPRIITSNS